MKPFSDPTRDDRIRQSSYDAGYEAGRDMHAALWVSSALSGAILGCLARIVWEWLRL